MPMYTWLDKNSGNEFEVVRSMSESDVPPTEDEAGESDSPREWVKLMSPVQKHQYGDNWRGRKGYW